MIQENHSDLYPLFQKVEGLSDEKMDLNDMVESVFSVLLDTSVDLKLDITNPESGVYRDATKYKITLGTILGDEKVKELFKKHLGTNIDL